MIDATHDPTRLSWVASANGHTEFPIQNLPFGIFSMLGDKPRGGVAIGDGILDISAALNAGLFSGVARDAAEAAAGPELNPLLALPASARRALRQRLSDILAADSDARGSASRLLHDAAACTLHLPRRDRRLLRFLRLHRTRDQRRQMFRPDNPLLPNYKYVPIGYHGRASSIGSAATDVRAPGWAAQAAERRRRRPLARRRFDYELEIGVLRSAPELRW